MIRLYLFLSLLLSSMAAAGQGLPGYVLTLNGDTLRGIITEESGGRIYLSSDAKGPAHGFRAGGIRGYAVTKGAPILSRMVHLASGGDTVRFVLYELTGPASLYTFANETGLLLAPAATDTLYELTALNWHLLFNRFLSACPTMRQTDPAFLELDFEKALVVRVLSQYNRCVDSRWRFNRPAASAAWRQSVDVQPACFLGYFEGRTPARYFPSAGAAWTGLRANGVLIGLHVNYTYASGYSTVYRGYDGNSREADQRDFSRLGVLSGAVAVGKRLGRPQRLNFFAGGSFGFTVVAHNECAIQQRLSGSNNAFQTVALTYYPNKLGLQLDFFSGVFIPLAARHEIRLGVVARGCGPFVGAGLQVAYCWIRP